MPSPKKLLAKILNTPAQKAFGKFSEDPPPSEKGVAGFRPKL
jgi:hypothetical protein